MVLFIHELLLDQERRKWKSRFARRNTTNDNKRELSKRTIITFQMTMEWNQLQIRNYIRIEIDTVTFYLYIFFCVHTLVRTINSIRKILTLNLLLNSLIRPKT